MKKERYIIGGMSCAACSAAVTRVVSKLDGVDKCEVNLLTKKMDVSFDETKVSSADFFRVVEKAGFTIELEKASEKSPKKEDKKEKGDSPFPIIISAFFTLVLLYISMGQMLFENLPLPQFLNIEKQPYNFALTQLLLCLPALYVGRVFFTSGFPKLFKLKPNMDSLVALGTSASLIYSIVMTYNISHNPHAVHNLYFESVAVVITLIKLGKFFESASRKKTTEQIKKLMELTPDTAIILKDNKEYEIPTSELKIGDTIVIKPGEKVPCDAVVKEGFSALDEQVLTGESLPIDKTIGDNIIGGSINTNGLLYATVTKTGEDTAVSQIIKFVEDASSKKAPISKTADKVAGVFVPAVIVIAVISFIVWILVSKDLSFSLKIFTSVLVVACPCALGLATPCAIMVGTGLGAKNGILIRNGEVLETTHKARAVVFDKTGTLTEGKMKVNQIFGSNETLFYAAVAEGGSAHPISKAILEKAIEKKLATDLKVESFTNISGKGISCTVDNKSLLVGKKALLEENGVSLKEFEKIAENEAKNGKTLVFVSLDNEVLGLITISDTLKPTAQDTVKKLKNMGFYTVLLSGDNKSCAEFIGDELSVDKVYSEVLPNEKAEIIKEIRKETGSVIMVGDGINDAVALTGADIGIAIGSGSDIAIESADIVLMKNEPIDVKKAINLSHKTIRNIKQNLFWAFCYNTVCIPIAAGVLYSAFGLLLSPMLAGLAMSLSSVFVVGNALRLRGKKL